MYSYGKKVVDSITSKVSYLLTPRFKRKRFHIENENEHGATDSKRSASATHSKDRKVLRAYVKNSKSSSSTAEASVAASSTSSSTTKTTLTIDTSAATESPQPYEKINRDAKNSRLDGYKTPMLVHPQSNDFDSSSSNNENNGLSSRPSKRKKVAGAMGQSSSLFLEMIPHDVMEMNIFSYLTEARDYFSLQLTCKEIKSLSTKMDILKSIDLVGDPETGKGSILNLVKSPAVAIERLHKFAAAGNQQALYMIGMIAAYCHGDRIGVTILKQTARKGCLRSAYALGLILRDCDKSESDRYLNGAIREKYLPACQELLSSQTVKERFGDLGHATLKEFFDPIGLNQLLGRCYLHSDGIRGVATSHCWNPLCGRWALKATQSNDGRTPQLQCPSKCLPPLSNKIEATLLQLVKNGAAKNMIDGIISHDSKVILDEEVMNLDSSCESGRRSFRVSRMKMCSSCRRAKYCSKLCQVYDWRSGRHKMECQYL